MWTRELTRLKYDACVEGFKYTAQNAVKMSPSLEK